MTSLHLRTSPDEPAPSNRLLLDWFGRGGASTVSGSLKELLHELGDPSPLSQDLLRLAVGVHSADKLVLRDRSPDSWTREIRLHVAVSDRNQWETAVPPLLSALTFLTNDRWHLRLRQSPGTRADGVGIVDADAVCLFSGGLDSLAGAIDLLEGDRSVVLVSHYDSNLLLPRQQRLFQALRDHYGPERVLHRPFFLRPIGAAPGQERPLGDERESTTRGRSFLFIAAACVVASALELEEVHVPENGFISLNVPIEVSRLGACSTRTTHPYFLSRLAEALADVGLPLEIENPYVFSTKGEVIENCLNHDLLLDLAPSTISCAHPEVGRWTGEPYRSCGYCYPCLMRRVSLHHVDADDASDYRFDVGDQALLSAGGQRMQHLRALINCLARPAGHADVLRSGPLPRGQAGDFVDLYQRGRDEIESWLAVAVPGFPD